MGLGLYIWLITNRILRQLSNEVDIMKRKVVDIDIIVKIIKSTLETQAAMKGLIKNEY